MESVGTKKAGNSLKLCPEAAEALQRLAAFHGQKNELADRLVLWLDKQQTDVQLLVLGKLSQKSGEAVAKQLVWNWATPE